MHIICLHFSLIYYLYHYLPSKSIDVTISKTLWSTFLPILTMSERFTYIENHLTILVDCNAQQQRKQCWRRPKWWRTNKTIVALLYFGWKIWKRKEKVNNLDLDSTFQVDKVYHVKYIICTFTLYRNFIELEKRV